MRIMSDVESINLHTGERYRRVIGDGESRLVPCTHLDHIRFGPRQDTSEEQREKAQRIAIKLVESSRTLARKEQHMTRCKFHCSSVTKTAHRQGGRVMKMLYTAEFFAVTEGSEENKKFFEWTPSGSLKIGVYKEDLFQPGEDYYLDVSEAEQ